MFHSCNSYLFQFIRINQAMLIHLKIHFHLAWNTLYDEVNRTNFNSLEMELDKIQIFFCPLYTFCIPLYSFALPTSKWDLLSFTLYLVQHTNTYHVSESHLYMRVEVRNWFRTEISKVIFRVIFTMHVHIFDSFQTFS